MSVDGLHKVDVANYIKLFPNSAMATLVSKGVSYPNSQVIPPSDSFPGLLALFTGASQKTTGVYYDDSWAYDIYSSGAACSGPKGGRALYDESVDFDKTKVFSGLDPSKCPINGSTCQPELPHSFPKVNTIYEVLKANSMYAAWADKHYAYDAVRGPSGNGCDDLFTPEVAAQVPSDYQGTFSNDLLKVQAIVNQINGKNSFGNVSAPVPTLFGNLSQTLSQAQKQYGYKDAAATFTDGVLQSLVFVDASIANFLNELKVNKLDGKTAVILTAKHGQSPIDPKLFKSVDSSQVTAAIQAVLNPNEPAQVDADTELLIWLNDYTNKTAIATAAAALQANAAALGLDKVLYGDAITAQFGTNDLRKPSIIGISTPGVIYDAGTSKIMEHGGFGPDDISVPIVVSHPFLSAPGTTDSTTVYTTQIAPTIMQLLGLDPSLLQGAVTEGTPVLPSVGLDVHVAAVNAIKGALSLQASGPAPAPASG
ncbi:g6143 [Coccomyxa elongata]